MQTTKTLHHGIVCAIIALLFYSGAVLDQKITSMFGFYMPAAAWFFIFIYPLCDSVTEVYGPKKTWGLLFAGYLVCCVFMLITSASIAMPYAPLQNNAIAKNIYPPLKSAMLSCFSLGYLAFFAGMFINVKLLGRWKLRFSGKYYFFRSYIASAISEGFVVVCANMLIWYHRIPFHSIVILILNTYALKLLLTITISCY